MRGFYRAITACCSFQIACPPEPPLQTHPSKAPACNVAAPSDSKLPFGTKEAAGEAVARCWASSFAEIAKARRAPSTTQLAKGLAFIVGDKVFIWAPRFGAFSSAFLRFPQFSSCKAVGLSGNMHRSMRVFRHGRTCAAGGVFREGIPHIWLISCVLQIAVGGLPMNFRVESNWISGGKRIDYVTPTRAFLLLKR